MAMVGMLLLAGCIGSDDDPTAGDGDELEPASEDDEARGEAVDTTTVTVYNESALHVGAGAPHPQDDGGLVEPVGPTATDTFEIGPEVEDVSYELVFGGGTGQARVEVYDPDGTLVFGSTQYTCAGAPGTWVCLTQGEDDGETSVSGTYEVRYYVAGAVEAGLLVEGEVPASTAGNATQPA